MDSVTTSNARGLRFGWDLSMLAEESPPAGVICLAKSPFPVALDEERALATLSPQDQALEIGLWVASDDEDFLPKFGKGGERILGCSGFSNASLSVKRDLTQSSH
jgi:hypothetical protein